MSATFQATEIIMLTTKPLVRTFSMESPEWIYLLPVADKATAAITVTIFYTDGTSATMQIPIGTLRKYEVQRINLSESNHEYSQVTPAKTISYMTMSINSSDDSLTLYPYYPSQKSDQVIAQYYRNSYGGCDSFITTGDHSDTFDIDRLIVEQPVDDAATVTANPQFTAANQEGTRGISLYSGFHSKDEIAATKDMFLVNDCLLHEVIDSQDVLIPVLIDQASITYPSARTNTRALQYSFKRAYTDFALDRIGGITTEPQVLTINNDTRIIMYFDSSGSMSSTETPLETMRDTLLRPALIGFYDNDDTLYDSRVTITSNADERTLQLLDMLGATPPDGNVVVMIFQDEALPSYHGTTFSGARTAAYDSDLAALLTRLDSYAANYYRGVIFQVDGTTSSDDAFQDFLQAVQNGTGLYAGTNGLSDRSEFVYKYDITDGGTASYYLTQVTTALEELGFQL